MGAQGSGNRDHWWRSPKKEVVEDCLSIDASRWTREGILKAGLCQADSCSWTYRSGDSITVNYEVNTLELTSPSVRLWYSRAWRATGQTDSADYHVGLATTRPYFGGLRWWLVCPLIVDGRPCNRRVSKLYLPGSARYFGCRHCHDLTYTSCQESHKDDALCRHLAQSLGWDVADVKRELRQLDKRGM
jgi:hypothetical protein